MTKIVINNAEEFSAYYDSCCANPPKFPISLEVKELTEKSARTITQNNALHKYFDMLADNLRIAGLDVMQTLRHDIEIPWTAELVKALIWAVIQRAKLDTESTTKLSTGDVGMIYDIIHRHMIDKHSISVMFPDREQLRLTQMYGDKK